MTGEIVIRVAAVSPELTAAASAMIVQKFDGYYRTEGFGWYAFDEVPATEWHIATTAKDSERFEFMSAFAAAYCKAGNQESVYMLDIDGSAYLVQSSGRIDPVG